MTRISVNSQRWLRPNRENNGTTVERLTRAQRPWGYTVCSRDITGMKRELTQMYYVAYAHPNALHSLKKDPTWADWNKYQNSRETMYAGEVGRVDQCRFISSTLAFRYAVNDTCPTVEESSVAFSNNGQTPAVEETVASTYLEYARTTDKSQETPGIYSLIFRNNSHKTEANTHELRIAYAACLSSAKGHLVSHRSMAWSR